MRCARIPQLIEAAIDGDRSFGIMAANYTIHDAHDLEYRVHFTLSQNPFIKCRDIQVVITGSDVTLQGEVRTYYQKQMAQQSLRQIQEIRSITNDLRVTGRESGRGRR